MSLTHVVHYLREERGSSLLGMLCHNSAQRRVGHDAFTLNWYWVTCPQCLCKAPVAEGEGRGGVVDTEIVHG